MTTPYHLSLINYILRAPHMQQQHAARAQLRRIGIPLGGLETHATWETLLWLALLSQSRLVILVWGAICVLGSVLATEAGSWSRLNWKADVPKAIAWAAVPFVVSIISTYCGTCRAPQRSRFSSPSSLLIFYVTAALGITALYIAALRLLSQHIAVVWVVRLATWGTQALHLAVALSPSWGSSKTLIAPVLFGASLSHSYMWTSVLERRDSDKELV